MSANWRVKMKDQRAKKKQGIQLLFDRVKLLIEIKSDPEFLSDCESRNVEPLDEIENEVSDVGHPFGVLESVMTRYPKKADWSKKLTVLIAEIIEKQKRGPINRPKYKDVATRQEKTIEKLQQELKSKETDSNRVKLMASGAKTESGAVLPVDLSAKATQTVRAVDWEKIASRQKKEIEELKRTIKEKEKTIENLRNVLERNVVIA